MHNIRRSLRSQHIIRRRPQALLTAAQAREEQELAVGLLTSRSHLSHQRATQAALEQADPGQGHEARDKGAPPYTPQEAAATRVLRMQAWPTAPGRSARPTRTASQ